MSKPVAGTADIEKIMAWAESLADESVKGARARLLPLSVSEEIALRNIVCASVLQYCAERLLNVLRLSGIVLDMNDF
jgi:hypothetical protein